ncbi:MAG: DUF1330 domain-containing protein [Pseudomonadota bacterium]
MKEAYWIAHVTVTDDEAYARYAALATKAMDEHGGTFLARGGANTWFEGAGRPRNVVARFPSMEAAQACYDSATYQEALTHARGASERELMIVEAL